MTTPEKAKGSQWERDVVKFLQENGFIYAERRGLAGQQQDKGDIVGLPGLVIECKNQKSFDLAGWIAEAEVEKGHARADYGVVFAKRRGKRAGQGYAIMTIEEFARLWRERDGL